MARACEGRGDFAGPLVSFRYQCPERQRAVYQGQGAFAVASRHTRPRKGESASPERSLFCPDRVDHVKVLLTLSGTDIVFCGRCLLILLEGSRCLDLILIQSFISLSASSTCYGRSVCKAYIVKRGEVQTPGMKHHHARCEQVVNWPRTTIPSANQMPSQASKLTP